MSNSKEAHQRKRINLFEAAEVPIRLPDEHIKEVAKMLVVEDHFVVLGDMWNPDDEEHKEPFN